ncbi:MAG: ferredoxin [Planctomycetes bacterium]|nr:ferredoxin [Planctomycetota bacterium]
MTSSAATLSRDARAATARLSVLDAVRASCRALDTRLLVDADLRRDGDLPVPACTGRALLARASGLALAGVRAAALLDGPWDADAALATAVGRHLPLVVHLLGRASPRHGTTAGAGHDALPALARSGAVVFAARSTQDAADLALLATHVAELSLRPVLVHHDPLPDAHACVALPDADDVRRRLGEPDDTLAAPDPLQSALFGGERRLVPRVVDVDAPATSGGALDPAAYARAAAADAVCFDDALPALVERACRDVAALTNRPLLPVLTHRIADAEFVLVATGSLAPLAELVADHARLVLRVRVGVVTPMLLHPLPDERLVTLLAGKKAVAVLERDGARGDADPPLLTALRAACARAVERRRGRHGDGLRPDEVPAFLSVSCGVAREPTPGDLLAVVERLRAKDGATGRIMSGVDFVRPATRVPKLQLWQERLLDGRPDLATRALPPAACDDLLPRDTLVLRVHAVGAGGGGRDLGERLASALGDALGRPARTFRDARPERLGLPRTTCALLTSESVPHLAPPARVDVVLHAAPFHARPEALLAGLGAGGVLLLEDAREPDALWAALPRRVQRAVRERRLRVVCLDARAQAEASADVDRARADVLLGALLTVCATPDADASALGARTLADAPDGDARRADVQRGCGAARRVTPGAETGPEVGEVPARPAAFDRARPEGPAHGGRFWERVGHLLAAGEEPLADPVAALGTLPARSSTLRDLSAGRERFPRLDAARCTGCGECWVACPDAAFDVRVVEVDALLRAAAEATKAQRPDDRLAPLLAPLGQQARKLVASGKARAPADALLAAWDAVRGKLPLDAARQAEVAAELELLAARLRVQPLVRGAPCLVESARDAFVSLCVDPEACKACGLCVEVCPEDAFTSVAQDEPVLAAARAALDFAARLPDDPGARLDASPAGLLLRRDPSTTPAGGDTACAGCGEKGALRLLLGAIAAERAPLVHAHVAELEQLHGRLHARARELVSGDVDLSQVTDGTGVRLHADVAADVERLLSTAGELAGLLARHDAGRAGAAWLATAGCSARLASDSPYAPLPIPCTTALLDDAADTALGLHEGRLLAQAREFALLRRARALLEGGTPSEAPLQPDDFTADEWALCPPVVLAGGDHGLAGAALGRVLALLESKRPLRVVLLDNGLAADAAGRRAPDARRTTDDALDAPPSLARLALTRPDVFVLHGSASHPEHLLDGLRRGLRARGPALFVLAAPCPLEHGYAPHESLRAARLAVASRAFPLFVHDPAGGAHLAERLDLSGNPAPEAPLGTHDDGSPASFGDVVAHEARFAHLLDPGDATGRDVVPLHELLLRAPDARGDTRAYVTLRDGRRALASACLVRHGDALLDGWRLLRELAGRDPAPGVREDVARQVRAEAERATGALQREHEARIDQLRRRIPGQVARRLAAGLLRAGRGRTVDEILAEAASGGGLDVADVDVDALLDGAAARDATSGAHDTGDAARESADDVQAVADPAQDGHADPGPGVATPSPGVDATSGATSGDDTSASGASATVAPASDDDEPLALDPYIDTIRCTSCNECTNLNGRMFAYDDKKRAYVKDPDAGTFAQLVQAAEKCPVAIIHPGTPRNPDEKNLEALVKRAQRFL